MTMVNRSIINEEFQNEVQSIDSIKDLQNMQYNKNVVRQALARYKKEKSLEKRNYQLHVIWAGWIDFREPSRRNHHQLASLIESFKVKFKLGRTILTILSRERIEVTTREYCNELRRQGGYVSRIKVKKSIGDDLDDLIDRLNDSEISSFIGWYRPEICYSYHACEISDPHDLLKLETGDQLFKNSFFKAYPDVEKEEMQKSESEKKFALSLCFRITTKCK